MTRRAFTDCAFNALDLHAAVFVRLDGSAVAQFSAGDYLAPIGDVVRTFVVGVEPTILQEPSEYVADDTAAVLYITKRGHCVFVGPDNAIISEGDILKTGRRVLSLFGG